MKTRPHPRLAHPGVRNALKGRLIHVPVAHRAACAYGHKPGTAGKDSAIRFTHILVVADPPGALSQALGVAKTIAARSGSRISLLGVATPIACTADFGYGPVVRHTPDSKLIACVKRRLMAIANRSFREMPPVTVLVRSGCCEKEIPRVARELDCDLIVFGVNEADIAASPQASVAASVIRQAHCPVLVLRQRDRCARHGLPQKPALSEVPGAERAGDV